MPELVSFLVLQGFVPVDYLNHWFCIGLKNIKIYTSFHWILSMSIFFESVLPLLSAPVLKCVAQISKLIIPGENRGQKSIS